MVFNQIMQHGNPDTEVVTTEIRTDTRNGSRVVIKRARPSRHRSSHWQILETYARIWLPDSCLKSNHSTKRFSPPFLFRLTVLVIYNRLQTYSRAAPLIYSIHRSQNDFLCHGAMW